FPREPKVHHQRTASAPALHQWTQVRSSSQPIRVCALISRSALRTTHRFLGGPICRPLPHQVISIAANSRSNLHLPDLVGQPCGKDRRSVVIKMETVEKEIPRKFAGRREHPNRHTHSVA